MILQDWVGELGLRHQGVLLSAIRGCDTASKDDPSKTVARYFRSFVLNALCGDARKAASFIEVPETSFSFRRDCTKFLRSMDQYPLHYVTHLMHASQVLAYYHPTDSENWRWFYFSICDKFHVMPESKEALEKRLFASEEDFGRSQ